MTTEPAIYNPQRLCYRIMLGSEKQHFEQCIEEGFIGVDYDIGVDLSLRLNKPYKDFKKAYLPTYLENLPERTTEAASSAASFTYRVCSVLKNGDYVVAVDTQDNIAIGEISGPYFFHAGKPLPHRRPVRWLEKQITSSVLSDDLWKIINSRPVVLDLKEYITEIEQIMNSESVFGAVAAVAFINKEFSASDIKWIKSVTQNDGKDWSYMEFNVGDTFPLNFSKNLRWYPTNYKKARTRDIIVLFQTIITPNALKGEWYITHLVSPINETIEITDNESHPYTRMVTVMAKNSKPALIDSKRWSLFKCNRGQICKIDTIDKRDDLNYPEDQKKQFVWDLFDQVDSATYNNILSIEKLTSDLKDYVAEEGRASLVLKLHIINERNPKIVSQAKEHAALGGKLFCEICDFDFDKRYPGLGKDFIECHHKLPISSGGIRLTRLEDLALVCSNCHRMLHRKHSHGDYYSVDQLKKLVSETRI